MAVGKWPRHWARGKLFRRGNALSQKLGKRGRVQNVYALAKSVRIRAKKYTPKVIEQASPKVASFLIDKLVLEGLRNGP